MKTAQAQPSDHKHKIGKFYKQSKVTTALAQETQTAPYYPDLHYQCESSDFKSFLSLPTHCAA